MLMRRSAVSLRRLADLTSRNRFASREADRHAAQVPAQSNRNRLGADSQRWYYLL